MKIKGTQIVMLAGIGVLGYAAYRIIQDAKPSTPNNQIPINPFTNEPTAGDLSLQKTNPSYQPNYNPADMLHSALYGGSY